MAKSTLHAEKVTRSDGVVTTVWKKDAKNSASRLLGLKASVSVQPREYGLHPADYALSWNPDVKPVGALRWWKRYAKETSKFGSKAELLDIIPSPFGELAVVWQSKGIRKQDANLDKDSGMNVSGVYLYNVQTGEKAGYVKIVAMNDESFKNSFGDDGYTNFRYHNRFSGSSYRGLNSYDDPPTDMADFRKKLWASAHVANSQGLKLDDGTYVAYFNVTTDYAPDDAKVIEDLERFSKDLQKTVDGARDYYSDKHPNIDYSSVPDEMKGAGIGAAMYIYAAKRIAGDGAVLRASGVQSNEAQSLWAKFASIMPDNVGEIELSYKGEKSKYPVLDFRSK